MRAPESRERVPGFGKPTYHDLNIVRNPLSLSRAGVVGGGPLLGCDSKKPVQEGSIGLVVFGAGHVNRAEPPELFKGGAFEKLAKRPKSPVSAKAPALNARGDSSSPHGRR